MATPARASGSMPPAPASAQEEEAPMLGRNRTVAKVGEAIESTGKIIGAWYPSFAHTGDFFAQAGSFVPDEQVKGLCPGVLVKAAAYCKRVGAEVGNVAMLLKGASGVCAMVGSALRRLNRRQAAEDVDPEVIYFTTTDELLAVLITWKENPRSIKLDVDPTCSVYFARRVELLLNDQGDGAVALFENSPTYQMRLAQYRRSEELKFAQMIKGVKEIFLERYSRTPAAPPATGVAPVDDKLASTGHQTTGTADGESPSA